MASREDLMSDYVVGPEEAETVAALLELGVAPDSIRGALAAGHLGQAVLDHVFARVRTERAVSAATIEQEGGPPVVLQQLLMNSLGVSPPAPHDPYFSPSEAEALKQMHAQRELWSPELTLQIARTYGRALARVARTQAQVFRLYVEPRLDERASRPVDAMQGISVALEGMFEIAEPWLVGGWRRLLEQELAQQAVGEVEARLGGAQLPGAVDVTFLFCDLKDFTAYAELEGDAAAITAIEWFAATVTEERGESGRIVKALGDGYMLCYADPREAVASGARMMDRVRAEGRLAMHASIHRGVAIAREGDYFGRSVNLAARLLVLAGRHELLATAPVVESAGEDFHWEPAGERRLRGVGQPVTVHRLVREASQPDGARGAGTG